MPILDLTLNNPLIKKFFEGNDSYIPTGELMYVHTHLIPNNFLSDIEVMILTTDQILLTNPRKSKQAVRLINAGAELGELMANLDAKSALRVMYLLRDIYVICKKIMDSIKNETPT